MTAELFFEPMEKDDLAEVWSKVKPFYQAVILDGMRCSDGRCFIRGIDMELGKVCLYVVTPLPVGSKIERHIYKEKLP